MPIGYIDWINIGIEASRIVAGLIKQHERPKHGQEKKKVVVDQTLAILGNALSAIGVQTDDKIDGRIAQKLVGDIVDTQVAHANAIGEFGSKALPNGEKPKAVVKPFMQNEPPAM